MTTSMVLPRSWLMKLILPPLVEKKFVPTFSDLASAAAIRASSSSHAMMAVPGLSLLIVIPLDLGYGKGGERLRRDARDDHTIFDHFLPSGGRQPLLNQRELLILADPFEHRKPVSDVRNSFRFHRYLSSLAAATGELHLLQEKKDMLLERGFDHLVGCDLLVELGLLFLASLGNGVQMVDRLAQCSRYCYLFHFIPFRCLYCLKSISLPIRRMSASLLRRF